MRKLAILGLVTACAALLAGCWGDAITGHTANTSTSSNSGTSNFQTIVVDSGPAAVGGTVNEPFITITVCSPANPTNCQTIDHILVDTGSAGLRIVSSVLSSSLGLTQQTDASGNGFAECIMFADGYSWGPVKTVNLQIAGEQANSLPMQVIGDPSYNSLVPAICSGAGASENTVATFGANGVMGVSPFAQDCGAACVQNAFSGIYYSCTSTSCQPTAVSLAQQLPNPVTRFPTDNNGITLSLPTVSGSGAASVSGTITFGIGTQTNNGLGSAQVYTVNSDFGYFTTIYKGVTYQNSLLDSGSNGYFFNDSAITQCSDGSGFYCPPSTLSLSALNMGQNGTNGAVNFAVGNENTLLNSNPSFAVLTQLAGTNGDPTSFDWGLPFFYGRNVSIAIEGASTPGGTGPYFAY